MYSSGKVISLLLPKFLHPYPLIHRKAALYMSGQDKINTMCIFICDVVFMSLVTKTTPNMRYHRR